MVKENIVIAHRGTTYWAPEETEAAFRWARNIGADYLELDLQMTKDSVLIALHDEDLSRTSNVHERYPDIKKPGVDQFLLSELRSLDFGSWFNNKNPERARDAFNNLKILTLQDVIMIAEGYRIKKNGNKPVKLMENGEWKGHYQYEKDPDDNKNRPGIYAETKQPKFEGLLTRKLKEYGWLATDHPKKIKTFKNKVAVANTTSRLILQTFYRESIIEFERLLPGIPKCMLLWGPRMDKDLKKGMEETISFCTEHHAEIMGTSIAGTENNYKDLTTPLLTDMIHRSGMIIHPYTFDTEQDFNTYAPRVDGVFTNRADLALMYYKRLRENKAKEILEELGY